MTDTGEIARRKPARLAVGPAAAGAGRPLAVSSRCGPTCSPRPNRALGPRPHRQPPNVTGSAWARRHRRDGVAARRRRDNLDAGCSSCVDAAPLRPAKPWTRTCRAPCGRDVPRKRRPEIVAEADASWTGGLASSSPTAGPRVERLARQERDDYVPSARKCCDEGRRLQRTGALRGADRAVGCPPRRTWDSPLRGRSTTTRGPRCRSTGRRPGYNAAVEPAPRPVARRRARVGCCTAVSTSRRRSCR